MLEKKFGRKTVYAITPEAEEELKNGWTPCDKKKGCACGTAKPAAKAEPKKETVQETK